MVLTTCSLWGVKLMRMVDGTYHLLLVGGEADEDG